MRQKGTNLTVYYATARHTGKLHPHDTELVGREHTAEEAKQWQKEFGGHVVKVTEVIAWQPVEE